MLPKDLDSTYDPRFNGAFRMNLDGPIDLTLLERSLLQIMQRHEALRTSFRVVDSEIQQIVLPDPVFSLEAVDLRALPPDKQDAEVDAICLHEAQTGFDLTKAPPLRAKLLHLNDSRHMLVLTIHQIICDGWSIGVLMEEMSKDYTALARQETAPLPPLNFQFGDYVVWQLETIAQPEAQTQLSCWRERLARCPQLEVAFDHDPAERSIQSGIVSQLLPRSLTEELRSLAQSQNTTFFVVTMSACMALLYRYTGKTDLALRTPLAGRTRVEFEPLIGQFVNQVILRSEFSDMFTFADLVAQVRERVWESLANQDIPYETVIHAMEGEAVNPNDLYRVNFVCQREYGRGGPFLFELNGTRLTTLPSKSQGALYDLNFFLVEREAGWRLSLEYRTGLYTQETADSLLQHFQELMKEVIRNPLQRLSAIALTPTQALEKRIQNLPSPATDMEETTKNPQEEIQAIPASFAQERFWTLSEVDPANPAFHMPVRLRLTGKLSVPLLERSFRVLIDRHEILRTTFSEIDGTLMQVIHSASPFSLQQISVDAIPEHNREVTAASSIQELLEEPFNLSTLPLFRAALYRLAPEEHILVLSIHHSIADAWSIQVFQRELWTAYEGFRQNNEFSFEPLTLQYGDFSIWQREGVESEATQEHLSFWLKSLSGELPVLNFPTDYAPAQQDAPKSSLETLLLSDELSKALKQFAQANDTTLYVVTLASFALMLSQGANAHDLIIGSPVVNRRVETEPLMGPFAGPVALRLGLNGDPTLREFVLAARNTTVEALGHTELPFELLLDKLQVRPVAGRSPLFQFYFFCQTAFLQARELQDLTIAPMPTTSIGTPFEIQLAIIERKEGVRAELEYNANLFHSATMKEWLQYYQSILTALTGNPDSRVSELPVPPHRAKDTVAASSHIAEQSSLQKGPEASLVETSSFANEPLTSELKQMWQAALGNDKIGLHDNFFALGGRSLVAARLIAKINKQYSLKLGLATFFNCPTIAELAALIHGQLTPQEPSSIVAVQPEGTSAPLFMVHGVGGNVLNFYDLAKSLGFNQPVYGVEAQALQSSAPPLTSLEELAAYYVKEVRKIQPEGPYHFLGYSYGGFVAFEMARQLQMANQKVELVGMLDTPVWRHPVHEEHHTFRKAVRQIMAVWTPFFHRLRPCTPMEIFDGIKSTILRTFYTFATANGMVIPPRLRSVYHINSFAAVNYVPKSYDGIVTMFRASREKGPRDLGWGKYSTQPVRVFEIPGAHLQVLSNENLPRVVKSLRQCLS